MIELTFLEQPKLTTYHNIKPGDVIEALPGASITSKDYGPFVPPNQTMDDPTNVFGCVLGFTRSNTTDRSEDPALLIPRIYPAIQTNYFPTRKSNLLWNGKGNDLLLVIGKISGIPERYPERFEFPICELDFPHCVVLFENELLSFIPELREYIARRENQKYVFKDSAGVTHSLTDILLQLQGK